jgi:hypothetical protein
MALARVAKSCSPSVKDSSFSCFDKKTLVSMTTGYNAAYPTKPPIRVTGKTKRQIWLLLQEILSGVCSDDEKCWANKTNIPTTIIDKALRPKSVVDLSSNINAWLSNYDIGNILQQYEKRFPSFRMLGVFPVDFNQTSHIGTCVASNMCNFDCGKIYNKRFAVCFNTDPHYLPGRHWVCIYCDLRPKSKQYGIDYFDSQGVSSVGDVPPTILQFIDTIRAQVKNIAPEAMFQLNFKCPIIQMGQNECGMFCIWYIISRLTTTQNHEGVLKNAPSDDDMVRMKTRVLMI